MPPPTLPPATYVRRRYPLAQLEGTLADRVAAGMQAVLAAKPLPPGATVGLCAGSRGIANLARITRAAVDYVRSVGFQPRILPAMGSHGGATPEGQTAMLADPAIGISEDSMGCPVDPRMETAQLNDGTPFAIHWALSALECDAVILINRVKQHTEIFGQAPAGSIGIDLPEAIHSGLLKMLAVGLGKQRGAETYHRQIPTPLGLGGAVALGARYLIESAASRKRGLPLGGLAIVENAHDETALIEGIRFDPSNPQAAFEQELRLLAQSRKWLPRLPVENLDALWIGHMGKRISGTGMDTNLLNRNPYGYTPGDRWRPEGPSVYSVVCSSLQPSSHGNAHGVGLADFVTERLYRSIDWKATRLNALTAFSPLLCSCPAVMKNDREAIEAALATSPAIASGSPRFAAILDTLHPGDALVSPAILQELDEDAFDFPENKECSPLPFDPSGHLVFPTATP